MSLPGSPLTLWKRQAGPSQPPHLGMGRMLCRPHKPHCSHGQQNNVSKCVHTRPLESMTVTSQERLGDVIKAGKFNMRRTSIWAQSGHMCLPFRAGNFLLKKSRSPREIQLHLKHPKLYTASTGPKWRTIMRTSDGFRSRLARLPLIQTETVHV